jgi:hypothetical protein
MHSQRRLLRRRRSLSYGSWALQVRQIEPLRTEQQGRRPEGTVYTITDQGRQELSLHRMRALSEPDVRSTTVEVALKWVAGLGPLALAAYDHYRRSL